MVFVHGYLAVIGFFDRLNYSVPSEYRLIEEVAADRHWSAIHLVLALALLGLLLANRPDWLSTWHNVSFGFVAVWAFFTLLWGLTTPRPVSLASPGLAAFAAVGTAILAHAWRREAERHDKGR